MDKAFEEQKRYRAQDPAQRWLQIQEMITWAEQNLRPELRRNRPRTHPAARPLVEARTVEPSKPD